MSVSVSVGPGTSLPQRVVLLPSLLGGQHSRGPLGPAAAAELSNGLVASAPRGTPPSPVPVSLCQRWERQPWGTRRLHPPSPCVLGSLLALAGMLRLQGEGAIPGICPRPLLSLVSVQKYSESCSVPGSQPICPPPLPGCVARPLPTPALATSIHGHQYSQGPRSPGKLGRAASA